MKIYNPFAKIRERIYNNHRRRVIEQANELYQIAERDGDIWLTFDGVYILPESMLHQDALSCIAQLRERYIKEHIGKGEQ